VREREESVGEKASCTSKREIERDENDQNPKVSVYIL
jgi:hypothetical protein